jgi:hypothetical protein
MNDDQFMRHLKRKLAKRSKMQKRKRQLLKRYRRLKLKR